ncbi:centrosomal protein of 63 kDa-B-like [Pollicipes pollicipes]|uniref:centrosomal protein of 63 kDa-B-like n=1 Tax=Pollicipes pollicipes TaxID=41117 RepID=UPI0018859B77|nr:centrosomal protein of 63 kDa-B-like [Pollicipes pollicipes]
MQRDWKRRLDERERAAEERTAAVRQAVEVELQAELTALSDQRAVVEQKAGEVELLRSFEAEVVQLRGLTHELMRELRVGNRQVEMAKMQEALVTDENQRLNELVRKQTNTINSIQKELQKARQQSETELEQTRSSLTAEWEDRVRAERSRLKTELDTLHAEEKHLAVESTRLRLEQEIQTLRQEGEQRVHRLEQELSVVREELVQKDATHQADPERTQKEANGAIDLLKEKLQPLSDAPQSATTVLSVREEDIDSSPLANGRSSGTDEDEEGDDAEEDDDFDEEDSEAAGEEIRRKHRRDLEHLLRGSQDQRAALQALLQTYETRAAQTQQQLRMAHAERSRPDAQPERPVAGAARLAAVLTALQECGDQLVRLIAARDEQRLRGVCPCS